MRRFACTGWCLHLGNCLTSLAFPHFWCLCVWKSLKCVPFSNAHALFGLRAVIIVINRYLCCCAICSTAPPPPESNCWLCVHSQRNVFGPVNAGKTMSPLLFLLLSHKRCTRKIIYSYLCFSSFSSSLSLTWCFPLCRVLDNKWMYHILPNITTWVKAKWTTSFTAWRWGTPPSQS